MRNIILISLAWRFGGAILSRWSLSQGGSLRFIFLIQVITRYRISCGIIIHSLRNGALKSKSTFGAEYNIFLTVDLTTLITQFPAWNVRVELLLSGNSLTQVVVKYLDAVVVFLMKKEVTIKLPCAYRSYWNAKSFLTFRLSPSVGIKWCVFETSLVQSTNKSGSCFLNFEYCTFVCFNGCSSN